MNSFHDDKQCMIAVQHYRHTFLITHTLVSTYSQNLEGVLDSVMGPHVK